MTTIQQTIADMKARADAATPDLKQDPESQWIVVDSDECHIAECDGEGLDIEQDARNALFFAHARTDVPKLIAALKIAIRYIEFIQEDSHHASADIAMEEVAAILATQPEEKA